MIEITIRQQDQDGHLGFSTAHQGIFDESKVYEGAVGPISFLRQSLMELCDKLEESRSKRICELQQIADNHLLTSDLRAQAREELERQSESKERDRELARKMSASTER